MPGLFVCPDEDLVTVVHALVTGPFDTPYEGGGYLVCVVAGQLLDKLFRSKTKEKKSVPFPTTINFVIMRGAHDII